MDIRTKPPLEFFTKYEIEIFLKKNYQQQTLPIYKKYKITATFLFLIIRRKF